MRLIGGLVSWEQGRGVDPASLEPMAKRGARPVIGAKDASIGFLSNLGQEAVESTDQVWSIADLDLTNLKELRDLVGADADRQGLLTALYALEGPRFVRRLRGAFAFALWDRRERQLLLAVDQVGIKRLYYATDISRTAFGSTANALAMFSGRTPSVNPTAVYNYMNFGFIPSPMSAFGGVSRLAPGHSLHVRSGRTTLEPYWDIVYPEAAIKNEQAAKTVFALTEDAVSRSLRGISQKDVGAFLSGGTDSSTVVGLMSRLAGEPVNAFSIGFREERYDELHYAKVAARHFAATHRTKIVAPEEALDLLPRLAEAYDEPFGNNSAIGTFFCAQLAREHGLTVLLAGDGGDEIFGGNERYRTDRIFGRYHCIPSLIRRGFVEPLLLGMSDRGGEGILGRAQRYIRRANLPNPRRFYSYEFLFVQEAADLLTPEFRATVGADAPYALAQAHYDRAKATAELNRLLYLDMKFTIGDNDLFKVTRTAELAGMNVRFPMLDIPLVEFTGTLPAHSKVRGLQLRHLFKRAFRELLPHEILAKQKHGFGVPTSTWIKGHPKFREMARDILLCRRAQERGYFSAGAIEGLFDRHDADSTPYYGDVLWKVLMLELWHRHYIDGGVPA